MTIFAVKSGKKFFRESFLITENVYYKKKFLVKGFLDAEEWLFVRNIFCNNCILSGRLNNVCYIEDKNTFYLPLREFMLQMWIKRIYKYYWNVYTIISKKISLKTLNFSNMFWLDSFIFGTIIKTENTIPNFSLHFAYTLVRNGVYK